MAVVPLYPAGNGDLQYLTLSQALSQGHLTIKEVSKSGSVPDLKAVNKSDLPVLLLDGEEVAGAKQNRVMNSSILLPAKSETTIPVTCTEQGRWSYDSPIFEDSGEFLAARMRGASSVEVGQSLRAAAGYRANQVASWERVACLMEDAEAPSPTAAMRDVYQQRRLDLDEYLKAFSCQTGQRGLLVFISGEVLGFDTVSLESAYRALHGKLIRSYAMEAIRSRGPEGANPAVEQAQAFIKEAAAADERSYDSVGLGRDHRFTGMRLVGSALIHKDEPIHTGFFRTSSGESARGIERASRRRRFRS
jgi:hypothetical protein